MTHQPRKRFGQHFLTDHSVIERIVQNLAPKATDCLVEIGAGLGAITAEVLTQVPHLNIVEIDRELVESLRANYGQAVTVYSGDALEFDFSTLASKQKIRVFGNLPYNISTPLMFHLLLYANHIENMLFMLQKEVVYRMCAQPNTPDYGRLSVMIQYACVPKRLFDIAPNAFSPPPKVMSSMVTLTPHGENSPIPRAHNFTHFADTVNKAFQHRRKTISNALKHFPPTIFASLNIDTKRRPETLSVTEYVALSNALIAE
jgi:16S rRNA (adenine1518-N6/adenine1519-N6)-dimethyltransferase